MMIVDRIHRRIVREVIGTTTILILAGETRIPLGPASPQNEIESGTPIEIETTTGDGLGVIGREIDTRAGDPAGTVVATEIGIGIGITAGTHIATAGDRLPRTVIESPEIVEMDTRSLLLLLQLPSKNQLSSRPRRRKASKYRAICSLPPVIRV